MTLHGRVDSVDGLIVRDYKSTKQFNAERLLEGYQWRYYLDMTEADIFRWKVFVIQPAGDSEDDYVPLAQRTPVKIYIVTEIHDLEQRRYPALGEDCRRVAKDYLAFMKRHARTIYAKREPEPSLLEQLERSLEALKRSLDEA